LLGRHYKFVKKAILLLNLNVLSFSQIKKFLRKHLSKLVNNIGSTYNSVTAEKLYLLYICVKKTSGREKQEKLEIRHVEEYPSVLILRVLETNLRLHVQ